MCDPFIIFLYIFLTLRQIIITMNNDDAAAGGAVVMAPPVPTTTTYRRQAVRFLQNHFRGISCIAITAVFSNNDFHFTSTFQALARIRDDDEATIEDVEASHPNLKVFIKTERKAKRARITNADLLDEMASIPELNEKKRADGSDDDVEGAGDEENNDGDPLLDGDDANPQMSECGCCYFEYSPETMNQCSNGDGHHCCQGCIKRYVAEQLDGKNTTEFKCIVDMDCTGSYSQYQLSKILSPKTNQRLTDRCFRADVEESGMNTVWICNKCGHVGFLGEEPLPPTVFCDSEECRLTEYCRLCKHQWHQGQTCEESEAERERLKDPILRAQEAMTAATARKCPNCHTPFEKTDGCNKMTCSKCASHSCYLCKQRIEGYDHFCRAFECDCNRCHLWRDPKEDDERARHEAGRRSLANDGFAEEEINRFLASTSQRQVTEEHGALDQPAPAAAAGLGAGGIEPPVDGAFRPEFAPYQDHRAHQQGDEGNDRHEELGENFGGQLNDLIDPAERLQFLMARLYD